MSNNVVKLSPRTPELEKLRTAAPDLHERVVGYAARQIYASERFVESTSKERAARATTLQELLANFKGLDASELPKRLVIEDQFAVEIAEAFATMRDPSRVDDALRALNLSAKVEAGGALIKDKRLWTLMNELSQHYKGAPPRELISEAIATASYIQQKSPDEFARLARIKFSPSAISDLAVAVTNATAAAEESSSFLKQMAKPAPLAFSAVGCVAIGACCHALMAPHQQQAAFR